MTTRKMIIIFLSVFTLIVVGLSIWGIKNDTEKKGKIQVTVEVYPKNASLSVDGKSISTGENYIEPGRHTFVASSKGFLDNKKEYDISQTVNYIGLVLTPYSDEAKKFVENDPNSDDIETIVGKSIESEGAQVIDKYPVVGELPHYDITAPYSIDYGQDEKYPDRPFLVINDSVPSGRIEALRWIYENNGGKITNLDIRFKDSSLIQSEQYK